MRFTRLALIPLTNGIMPGIAFGICYAIAVVRDDVTPILPQVSDIGTIAPESCIFAQLLNTVAALGLLQIFIRYKMIKAICPDGNRKLVKMNKAGLILGTIGTAASTGVANFQLTAVMLVHQIAAITTFVCGVVYGFVQTAISYNMYPTYNGLTICRVRLVITITGFVTCLLQFVCGGITFYAQEHSKTVIDILHWKPTDDGYIAVNIGTAAEWIMMISCMLFSFTFVREFTKMDIEIRARMLVRHLSDEPDDHAYRTEAPITTEPHISTIREPLLN